jgi:hypothetical protein
LAEFLTPAPSTLSLSLFYVSYASGGEDGYIRLHFLDPEYFEKYPDTTDDDDVLANFKGTVDNARV